MMNKEELQRIVATYWPEPERGNFIVEEAEPRRVRVRLKFAERYLRAGNTLSGPAQMTLADSAVYLALLATIGPAYASVTANLSIDFLRKPAPRDLICHVEMLKVGKRLATGEARIHSDGQEDPVAVALVTYAIPAEFDHVVA